MNIWLIVIEYADEPADTLAYTSQTLAAEALAEYRRDTKGSESLECGGFIADDRVFYLRHVNPFTPAERRELQAVLNYEEKRVEAELEKDHDPGVGAWLHGKRQRLARLLKMFS